MEVFKRIISVLVIVMMITAGVFAAGTQPVSAASSSSGSTVKAVTKVSTKTTNKSVKLKQKAKKSQVVTKTTTKKTKKVLSNTEKKKVVEEKTVKTTTKSTYTKKSKVKKVKTTVKITTKTTTTTYKVKTDAEKLKEISKAVPSVLMSAFNKLGFTVKINSKLSTAGNFSTSKHSIQLKTANADHLLHEMGHFLSCLKGNAAQTADFVKIYNVEKGKYSGSNKKYVTSTSDEYFAESYRDYVKQSAALKKQRPQTYNYIKNAVSNISQQDIDSMYQRYSWAW